MGFSWFASGIRSFRPYLRSRRVICRLDQTVSPLRICSLSINHTLYRPLLSLSPLCSIPPVVLHSLMFSSFRSVLSSSVSSLALLIALFLLSLSSVSLHPLSNFYSTSPPSNLLYSPRVLTTCFLISLSLSPPSSLPLSCSPLHSRGVERRERKRQGGVSFSPSSLPPLSPLSPSFSSLPFSLSGSVREQRIKLKGGGRRRSKGDIFHSHRVAPIPILDAKIPKAYLLSQALGADGITTTQRCRDGTKNMCTLTIRPLIFSDLHTCTSAESKALVVQLLRSCVGF